jgi:hypothetical protein
MHDRQQVLNHFLFGDNCSLFSTSNSVPCSHKAILVGYSTLASNAVHATKSAA